MATHFKGPVFSATNICKGFQTTATAAGTTTLVPTSAGNQVFTGSTTQTVLMPKAYDNSSSADGSYSQLPLGYEITFWNNSSGTVTVQDSTTGAIGTVAGGAKKTCICTGNTTAAGTWTLI